MWKETWERLTRTIDRLEQERRDGKLFLFSQVPLLIGLHLLFLLIYSLLTGLTLRNVDAQRWTEIAFQGGLGLLLIGAVLLMVRAHRRQWRGSLLVDLFGTGLFLQGYALLAILPDLLLRGPTKGLPWGQFATFYSWVLIGILGTGLILAGATVFVHRYETERSERRRLEALMQFTAQLSQRDEQRLLDEAAEQLQALLAADSSLLYLWDEGGEVLVPSAARFVPGTDQRYIDRVRSFRVPRHYGAVGRAFETGRPHMTGNAQKDRYAQPLPGYGLQVKSGLYIPIGEERPIGVVRLTRPGVDQFDQTDLDLAVSFARQVHLVLEHTRTLRELAELSVTDHLTGLYNARHLFSILERELDRARRHHQPLSVIMLDADGLKQVNDQFGHQQGDQFLRRISQVLQETLRSSDWAFRYAGDEFVLILPQTEAADGSLLGERLRERIAQSVTVPGLEPTFSVGVAAYPTHADTVEGVLEAADAALYASKRSGKNRLTIAPHQQVAVSQMEPEAADRGGSPK